MTYYGMSPLGAVPGGGYDLNGSATLTAHPPVLHPGWSVQPVPRSEAQRQQAGAYLQRCYQWLEQAVQVMPQIADLAPALVTAVQQYEAQQYDACLAQVMAVIQTVHQVRLSVPALPPL